LLVRTGRILAQRAKDKNKFYALHAPEVECTSKGKARTPYEFGVKVSIATTLKEGLVLGMRSKLGNPYDGHTLAETLEQVGILAERRPTTAIKGYRAQKSKVRSSCARARSWASRGLGGDDPSAQRHRVGHRAHEDDGRLGRNPPKGDEALHGDVR
jgi:IS5 family transposase